MGWTHDIRGASRNRHHHTSSADGTATLGLLPVQDHRLGIPRILSRRARWVGARLRHARD
ncbi:hypothetical protein [Actinacidiphila yeochonensis]|uniref:hypothetical protein n=1 Tax=Actinacidiphila yeochonensis TaxID=89050 RepID=UPI00056C44E8|nr:hypothetical protein [Actinacidiphila yeochonensis]